MIEGALRDGVVVDLEAAGFEERPAAGGYMIPRVTTGKRMRYLELETTYSEIVVLTQLANVGISGGLLTRLELGTV